jgi:hypothetical protein
MIRKTFFAVATVAAIGAAALIPTEACAGGGGKGGGMGGHHGHWGHGYGGGFGGIVVIGPSCWRWVPGLGRYMSATKSTSTVSVLAEAPVLRRETGAIHLRNMQTTRSSRRPRGKFRP